MALPSLALLCDDATELHDDLVRLRHRPHRKPEARIDLPRTQEKVLAALDGLPLDCGQVMGNVERGGLLARSLLAHQGSFAVGRSRSRACRDRRQAAALTFSYRPSAVPGFPERCGGSANGDMGALRNGQDHTAPLRRNAACGGTVPERSVRATAGAWRWDSRSRWARVPVAWALSSIAGMVSGSRSQP
ncbi:hypothetical protein QBC98_007056 [Kitasatospora acidiphila]